MARESAANIKVNPNVRCLRLYPVEGTKKQVPNLKTIGILLTPEQAIHLARVLLAVSSKWKSIDITGYRFEKRKSDGTYRLTVTGE